MEINIKPRFDTTFAHRMNDGHIVLAADANFARADGRFSGFGMHLQASCLNGEASPHPEDAEMFYQAVALLSGAPGLLEVLGRIVGLHEQDRDGGFLDANEYSMAVHAIAKATTHPLQDEMEAREIAYEESQEMARACAAERADLDEGHDEGRDHLTDDNTEFGDNERPDLRAERDEYLRDSMGAR